MVSLPVKALIGLGVAGAVGGGGYGIYSVAFKSSSQTIADILKEEGKELLSFEESNNSIWDSRVTSFPGSGSESIQLEGFTKETDDTNATEKNRKKMQDACRTLSSTVFDDSKKTIKEQVKKWCIKDATQSQ